MAVEEVLTSADPTKVGTYKSRSHMFAYEIGRSLRVTWPVHRDIESIQFVSVGDHKSVYGHD